MTTRLAFDVEQAGCPSCAARIRAVLDPLARLDEITIDEEADLAKIRCSPLSDEVSEEEINRALADASQGAGHAYRVRPRSWRVTTTPREAVS